MSESLMPQPQAGLLDPNSQTYGGPTPMPPIPGLMRPVGQPIGMSQVMLNLQPAKPDPDGEYDDNGLPDQLKAYAAGLRPTIRPAEAPWQQEIIYDRLQVTDDEVASAARYFFHEAERYDQALSQDRMQASDYYNGKPFGGEEKGRSQLVMTVVRDTIRSTLPSLLRVFTGVDDPILFTPISTDNPAGADAEATALSRQATDYCRWALFTANDGWRVLHDAMLDALTRKAGWVRWYWGARRSVRTEVCEGMLLPQLQMLLAEPGITAQRIVRRPMTGDEQKAVMKTPQGMMWLQRGGPPELWAARITRQAQQGWPQVRALPAEAVWIVADAPSVEDARGIFIVQEVPASSLIEIGLDAECIRSYAAGQSGRVRTERIARSAASGNNWPGSPPGDDSQKLIRHVEGWLRMDTDGDGISELIHVHLLGNAEELVQWERTDEIPLACFTPYREPGRVIGLSVADMVMDLQRTESRVMRSMLDSLSQSIFPRTAVVVGQANLADVRQTAIGSIIRMSSPNAVQELVKPFAGKEALPIMASLEAVRESRTGITRASQGLTVDELQSTAPVAVSTQVSAAQDRLDMVARTMAETGLAPLYKGLLRMLARQQDRPNTILLRGQWIQIDPRALCTDWEADVNVGGKGTPMERLAMLSQVASKQEQVMQLTGLQNPLVGIPEYRNTLARMLETANISDVSSYFKALPPGWQPPPPPEPPPNPDLLLANVQQQKTAADVENDRAKQQTDRANALLDDDRERAKAALDNWVKVYTTAATSNTPVPSIDEFTQAMSRRTPAIGLLADLPPQGAPITVPGGQGMAPAPPRGPQAAMGMPGAPQRPSAPMMPPSGSTDPVMAQAVRSALQGRGMPTAESTLAARGNIAQGIVGPALARTNLQSGTPPNPSLV